MSSIQHKKTSGNFPLDCSDWVKMGEPELSVFFRAVSQLFGQEPARRAAEDWLEELSESILLPPSTDSWRHVTVKVAVRLARRLELSSRRKDSQSRVVETNPPRVWKLLHEPSPPKMSCPE
jgi:hypothetical protein